MRGVTSLNIPKYIWFILVLLFSSCGFLRAQNWILDSLGSPAFIENKGQLEQFEAGREILYGVNGQIQVLFTKTGIQYRINASVPMTREEKEEHEREMRDRGEQNEKEERWPEKKVWENINMEWVGANPNCTVIALDENPGFQVYPALPVEKTITNVKSYRKIIYLDLYPGIDVEYFVSARKGVKYTLNVHPGADPSLVKIKYDHPVKFDSGTGNISLSSKYGDIGETAPVSFYADSKEKINSAFEVNGNTITFKLDSYDKNQTLCIDPWLLTGQTSNQTPFQIERDAANNVYVYAFYGQLGSWQVTQSVIKFSPAGVFQWSVNMGWMLNSGWDQAVGNLTIDAAGNSYATNFQSAPLLRRIMKINTAGTVVYNVVVNGIYECSYVGFNCDESIFVAGGPPFCCGTTGLSAVNPANGASSQVYTSALTGDVRSGSFGKNGILYLLTPGQYSSNIPPSGFLTAVNPQTGYSLVFTHQLKAQNELPGVDYGTCPLCTPNIYDGIKAGCNFLYTYLGDTLQKRDLNTGSIISSVAIPGGLYLKNMGIDMDDCGNVYVGSQTGVYVFDPNLSQLSFFPTPFKVLAVAMGTNNTFYACGGTPGQNSGTSFIAQFSYVSTCPQPLTITLNTSSCAAASATANATFCSPPYTYLWSNGQTTQTATGLIPGNTYTVVVTGNGMCATDTATITIPPGGGNFSASVSSAPSNCASNSGSATATPSGGVSPYTYSWAPSGGNAATANNLAAGTYTVTVTDATGCTTTCTVTIASSGANITTTLTSSSASCNASTGSATVTPSGGTSPYTYAWTPSGGNAATASNLAAGTYTCTITDAAGCSTTCTVTITNSNGVTASLSASSNVSCFGANNGSATASPSGGASPYTYAWAPSGGNAATANNLSPGTYTCTITDANGCTSVASVTITQPAQLTLSATSSDISCNGSNNGSATANLSGGTGPYTYSWTPSGGNTATAGNLAPGSYTCTITDANGCTSSASVTITQPAAIQASTTTISANCGAADGSAAVAVSGGTGTLSYSWSPGGGNAATLSNIAAGTYTVTITDANGCTQTATAIVGNINGVTIQTQSSVDETCFNSCNASASVTASGGTQPYTYSWAPSGGNAASASGLCAGTYTCTITDDAGCTTTAVYTITQPSQLNLAVAPPVAVCSGTAANLGISPSGGTPAYTITWNPGNLSGTNPAVTPSATTTYTVVLTDANGCADSATQTITVNPMPVAGFIADDTSGCAPLCVNFTDLSVIASPDNISSWNWNFGDGGNSSAQNPAYCYNTPGTYSVSLSVISSNGCASSFTINNYISVLPSPNAAFSFNPTNPSFYSPTVWFTDLSTGANQWLWNFGDENGTTSILQNPNFSFPDTGCYVINLTVTNNVGCSDDTSDLICVDPEWSLYVPNTFTPNGDGTNDGFRPYGEGIDPANYELWIFDRWGNLIFHTTDWNMSWDGRVQDGKSGEIAQIDTYVWKIRCLDILGGKHQLIGHVNLVK